MSVQTASPDTSIAERMEQEVRRARLRNVKGWNYLISTGPTPGASAKEVVLSRGTLQLYHYRPQSDEIYRTPVLLVMATTNRAYIFDIAPGQSLVEFMLKSGYDVYVLDWEPPRADESRLRLEDYTQGFIPECIEEIATRSGERDVSIIGYCMGGVLSVIYAALHVDGPLKNLVCLTTPFDWTKYGLFNVWSDARFFDVDSLVDTQGNVPSELIFASFEMLRPATKVAKQIEVWDKMWNDEYVKSYRLMDRWSNETLPLAGEYFRQLSKELMTENKLYTGDLMVGGQTADVGAIRVPFLHAVAQHDHIVPYESSRELVQKIGSQDKEEVVFKGGHVSLLAGGNAVRRLWPKLDAWLGPRSE